MNRYIAFLIIIVVVALVLLKEKGEHKRVVVHTISTEQIVEIDEAEEKRKMEDKPLIETTSSDEQSLIDEVLPDEEWEENIKSQLIRQAYDENLDVQIIKEKSLTWEEMGRPIEVESVKISLRNPAGETSTFRALVEQNTGKILRTWDRPVIDPINPRERNGIKISPLYHQHDE